MKSPPSILFLYASAFSTTGGLEKFNRAFCKALSDLNFTRDIKAAILSAYDGIPDRKYVTGDIYYLGFSKGKIKFTLISLLKVYQFEQMILGHINLAIIALLSKLLFPGKKLTIITHGIEVWSKPSLPWHKKKALMVADEILSVSNFTKQKLISLHGIDPEKIKVFHNAIDPYFKAPNVESLEKPAYLLNRYGLKPQDKIMLTITRYNSHEKFKGYDLVLKAMAEMVETVPGIKYIMAGKCGGQEKQRLDTLIAQLDITHLVTFTGFIPEEEITDHYLLADTYIMPSKKEGFGIVFIEAAACGLHVIAGNKDGSTDALLDGKLGSLIDPDNEGEIQEALEHVLTNKATGEEKRSLQTMAVNHFGYDVFLRNLKQNLTNGDVKI